MPKVVCDHVRCVGGIDQVDVACMTKQLIGVTSKDLVHCPVESCKLRRCFGWPAVTFSVNEILSQNMFILNSELNGQCEHLEPQASCKLLE